MKAWTGVGDSGGDGIRAGLMMQTPNSQVDGVWKSSELASK